MSGILRLLLVENGVVLAKGTVPRTPGSPAA
jgi:hypothetical protein